jgi:hypothetical protein
MDLTYFTTFNYACKIQKTFITLSFLLRGKRKLNTAARVFVVTAAHGKVLRVVALCHSPL